MPEPVTCPGCDAKIKVRDEHAGKKVKCPKCGATVPVPAAEVEDEVLEGVAVTAAPAARKAARPKAEDDEPEPDEDAPRVSKKGFVPCPRCGAEGPRKVKWTPWGSFYGPAMFNHVRCVECGYKYNGKSGRSNLIPAIIFMSIPILLIAGIVVFMVMLVMSRMTPQ
jgi:predicted Zn finger-like uncharacterized protein